MGAPTVMEMVGLTRLTFGIPIQICGRMPIQMDMQTNVETLSCRTTVLMITVQVLAFTLVAQTWMAMAGPTQRIRIPMATDTRTSLN